MKIADVRKAKWSELHYLVLAAAVQSPAAPADDHWKAICTVTGRTVAIGQVYAAIDRLEAFECVTSRVDVRTPPGSEGKPQSGYPARFVTVTSTGRELLALNPLLRILDVTGRLRVARA